MGFLGREDKYNILQVKKEALSFYGKEDTQKRKKIEVKKLMNK